jgi:hypothetical protein
MGKMWGFWLAGSKEKQKRIIKKLGVILPLTK